MQFQKIEKYVVKRELLQEHTTDCFSELHYSFSMVSNQLLVIHHHHSFNLRQQKCFQGFEE